MQTLYHIDVSIIKCEEDIEVTAPMGEPMAKPCNQARIQCVVSPKFKNVKNREKKSAITNTKLRIASMTYGRKEISVRILIIGGGGSVGRHVAAALSAAGYSVEAPARQQLDLTGMDEAAIGDRLSGADAVINCAGLISGPAMQAVHADGTQKLLKAAATTGVSRLLHVSALGAAASGETRYQRTKGLGEDALRAYTAPSTIELCILKPSLIIGRGGASTAMFSALARS